MRTFMLAVTGLLIAVAACSSYGTSVVEVGKTKAPVASVSLSIPSSLAAGRTARAIATPKDANGAVLTDRPVTWYTSSAAVASVNDSGVISAVAPGTALLSAVSEGVSGQATMAVTPPTPTPVATVTVGVTPSAILIGQTAVATATLKDSAGNLLSDRAVTWESSNTSVATVDPSGTVNATGLGNAMIKASIEGKSNAAALSVSAPAPVPVASISVSPPSASLQVGSTLQLSAVTLDANNNVLTGRLIGWSSSNTGIATVSSSGLVRAIAAGSVSITASSEGQTASAAITVSAPAPVPVASVSVSPSTSSIQVGATVQLSAVTRDANNNVLTGRVISWSSNNTGIATVSGSGLVTAVAAGNATITATSETKTGTAAITVSVPAPVPVASVSVSPSTSSIQVGATVQLSAVTRDANNNVLTGRVINWSSNNTGIATVSGSGLVTGVAAGNATITATSETKTGTAAITVSAPAPVPVASVTVSPTAPTVQVGGTVQFSAVTRDANNNILTGRTITWTSNNLAVATVSASALGTAVAAGSAQITATSEGKVGSGTLTVTSPPPPPPPGTDTLWRRNEPAGMTFIDERPFNSLTETDSPHVPFWFWAGGSIITDASAPHSPSNVLRATYATGFIGGSASLQAGVEAQGISNRTFYISWWAKYSSNWFGHLTGVNKQCYFAANGSAGQAFFEANGVGTNSLRPVMVLQSGYATDGTFYPNLVPNAVIPRDQWFYVEVVLVGNTAGNSDGSFDWYLNGVHVGSKTGLLITTTATSWDRFNFDPIWGGAGDVVPATQTLDLDDVYLSGKK